MWGWIRRANGATNQHLKYQQAAAHWFFDQRRPFLCDPSSCRRMAAHDLLLLLAFRLSIPIQANDAIDLLRVAVDVTRWPQRCDILARQPLSGFMRLHMSARLLYGIEL
jgi:hypothetical protein